MHALFAALLEGLPPRHLLCLASELTTDRETNMTKRIDAWRAGPPPALDKRPTVFLLLAG
jgi:16S rRNA (cytidine1402-2'-O)-methyltransferase